MQPSASTQPPKLPRRRPRPVRRIDDFIRPARPQPTSKSATKPPVSPQVRQRPIPPPQQASITPVATPPTPKPEPPQPAKQAKQAASRPAAQTYINKSTVLVIMSAMALGFLAQFQFIGQIVVGVYAIASFIFRIPSKTTFMLALLSLGVVPIAITLGRQLIAENFGAYSFLLFAIGALQVCIELVRETKLLRK
ncbi:MAG: hypothetical protein ACREGJ_03855 [Candidatus Saccharimonadales bacterium]